MKIHHTPYHWISVALILAALLFTLSEAHGQGAGSSALFEGRPAMAGAQAGLGAHAGPPQGGIGVQGTDASQRTVTPPRDRNVSPARDGGIAKDQRGTAKKVTRTARRTLNRNRQGINPIDSDSN